MGLRRVREVWRGPTDVAAQDEQLRPLVVGASRRERVREGREVVGHFAEFNHVPAIGAEALRGVVGEGE